MTRFPPTLGIVGHDFGYKPAFSVAVVQQGLPVKQQEDSPPIPATCHNAIGDEIAVTISGVLGCDGCYPFTVFGSNDGYQVSWVGINGSLTAVWDGVEWNVVIGTATLMHFTSGGGTCTGDPIITSGDILLELQCSGFNRFNVTANALTLSPVLNMFQGIGLFTDAINNEYVLGECGPGFPTFHAAYGGVLTML